MGDSFTAAAERRWFAIAPDGTEHSLVLAVGMPTEGDRDWSVDVSLGVLDPKIRKIFGVDSWQAIHLAMKFLALQVTDAAEDGWRFFWAQGGDEASPSDLFF